MPPQYVSTKSLLGADETDYKLIYYNKEIAQQPAISVRPVQTHLLHINSKLRVNRRVEAVMLGLRIGLQAGYGSGDHFPQPSALQDRECTGLLEPD